MRILTGKLRDGTSDLLTPTHSQRHGRRFANHVSNRLIAGGTDPSGWRLPAAALETSLCSILAGQLRQTAAGHGLLTEPEAWVAADLMVNATAFADRVAEGPAPLGSMIASDTRSGAAADTSGSAYLGAELRADSSLIEIAHRTGHSKPYLRARLPLELIAPRVQAAILSGRQPAVLCVSRIIREDLSMDWGDQAHMFGLG